MSINLAKTKTRYLIMRLWSPFLSCTATPLKESRRLDSVFVIGVVGSELCLAEKAYLTVRHRTALLDIFCEDKQRQGKSLPSATAMNHFILLAALLMVVTAGTTHTGAGVVRISPK
jgi:hypothetical protein